MDKIVDVEIGKRIKLRRTVLGFSQAYTANALNLTFQQVQKYEKGINSLSSNKLYSFASLLRVPVSYFFEGLGSGSTKITAKFDKENSFGSDREALEVMKVFNKIESPYLRKKMIELLHLLIDDDIKSRVN
ncbi:MAG: helix-turn-helix transcriptional regulator [Pseudomonadota bacterium]